MPLREFAAHVVHRAGDAVLARQPWPLGPLRCFKSQVLDIEAQKCCPPLCAVSLGYLHAG